MMKQFTSISNFFSSKVSIEPVGRIYNDCLRREIRFSQNRDSPLTYTPSTRWLTLILYFAIVTATDTKGERQHFESFLLPSANGNMENSASHRASYIELEDIKLAQKNSFSR